MAFFEKGYTVFPMDSVQEIKARLPIEELVAKYVAVQKKGRNFVALCPFHNDKHPSLLVSPDKGIAYCFACQHGGDIFTFYQQIEHCDFRQALKDLAERAGVKLEEHKIANVPKADEKDRIRKCLETALAFYQSQLTTSTLATEYIAKRGVTPELLEQFQIGYAPDSFNATYDMLLKQGFSRKEIIAAGLGIQKDLKEERIYDRFRNRLMFPIHDTQGGIVGFGGRTLGNDDAKYVNSSEGILYHKSSVLYGFHHAKESIRNSKKVILVEGYFDVIACHRVGVTNVVAVSGTALTEEHVKLLKRYAERAVLCLDQDRAGQDAAERAFHLLAGQNMYVEAAALPHKDPDETANADPALLQTLLSAATPYLHVMLARIAAQDLKDAMVRRQGMQRVLSLIRSLPGAVERSDYLERAAQVFGTTESALKDDLKLLESKPMISVKTVDAETHDPATLFSTTEITLGLLLLHPDTRSLLTELIPPEEPFTSALFEAMKKFPVQEKFTVETLDLSQEYRERAGILQLFCEEHAFADWSESLATREIRKNILAANREILRKKQKELSQKLIDARKAGKFAEEAQLSNQYQQILKLANMAH